MSKKKDAIKIELEKIRKRNKGILRAEDVVSFAQNPDTALHSRFTWDDTEAARQYRIWQAREIIRVEVTILPHTQKSYSAYVSLKSDRKNEGGGYRSTIDVLSDEEYYTQLLDEAKEDLEYWREKYHVLQKELKAVFAEIDKVTGAA